MLQRSSARTTLGAALVWAALAAPEVVQAAKPTADYDGRYGAMPGFWTTEQFVAAPYESLKKNQQE